MKLGTMQFVLIASAVQSLSDNRAEELHMLV